MMKNLFWIAWACSQIVLAQGPPPTDIFVVDLNQEGAQLKLGELQRVTDRNGYDNQPSFRSNQQILFTSIDEGGQADTYQYDLGSKQSQRMTQTPESEYSPTLMPDAKGFSVVRVEADRTQRLWRFPFDGGEPSLILADVKPVGYHVWLNADEVALFVLGQPPKLQWVSLAKPEPKTLMANPGRSLHKIPGQHALAAVQKPVGGYWVIKRIEVNPSSEDADETELIRTRDGSEDFAWTPDGLLLMGEGASLYFCRPGDNAEWQLAGDLAEKGVKRITRLAVSPDGHRLALVTDR